MPVVAALVATAAIGGCTSAASKSTERSAPASGVAATRWWSNSAAQAGSHIDMKDPRAAAVKLHGSATDYCSMLRQTVAAGKSILPGVTAKDPALLASTKAFVSEIRAVAPSAVAGPWKVLGEAVIAVVASGGALGEVKGVDAAAVQTAATTVAADAKRNCHVDLSAAAP
jgi:hypothetical protein